VVRGQVKEDVMGRAYNMHGRDEKWVGELEEKGPCGRPRCRWECFIIIDLREIGWEVVVWIQLHQDRVKW